MSGRRRWSQAALLLTLMVALAGGVRAVPVRAAAISGTVTAWGRKVYCPERGVTRAEMAAFLDHTRGQAELKLTTDCGTDKQGRIVYCPDRGVIHADMTIFILRAYA